MATKPWKIIPRPLLETVLNNHVQHPRVPQTIVLHGPRGVGKTTLLVERLLNRWNEAPHVIGYVDFAQDVEGYHPLQNQSFPWSSWSNCPPPTLKDLRCQLESCLESMVQRAVRIGNLSSQQIYSTLTKWYNLNNTLRRIIGSSATSSDKISTSTLWDRAIFIQYGRLNMDEIDGILGLAEKCKTIPVEEASYSREAVIALRLAKEVIRIQQSFRANAVAHLNHTGGYSRSLAHSSTDWPCLLLELLSISAEVDHFQPKLIINNIDVLRHAILTDNSSVSASQYHDSLIWRIIALGLNERCLPIILVTSDSYYSHQAYMDFGFPDIFISRETFGWSPEEAKLHMVPDYFSESEWKIVSEVFGPNARHLFELHALKQRSILQTLKEENSNTIEDIVDVYLSYLQIAVVNPAMDKALSLLQKFCSEVRKGKISKDHLRFGAPWRHPPKADIPDVSLNWAKIQMMDFVQSLVNAEFGVNYLADSSLEIFDDPSALALLEVGLLYAQRDPSFFRPISRGIQRCLVRWLVQQRMQMNLWTWIQYQWQRFFRGRSYRHLMLQIGYK